jgi:hypothetical protein
MVVALGLVLVLLLAPMEVGAAALADFAGCSGLDCSACNLVSLANGVIVWLIGFTFLIFMVVAVAAGFGLVTSGGNRHALDEAKNKFTSAFVGLIIILSAWLIVDTVMRGLVGGAGHEGEVALSVVDGEVTGWLFWSEVQCYSQVEPADYEEYVPHIEDGIDMVPTVEGPAGMPVAGVGANCGLDESSLISIPGQGSHRAIAATVSRFTSMKNALASRGISLTVTSSYRSDARQTELWDECPTCQAEGTVARPCSRGGNGSRHSSGVALDLSSSGDRCEIIKACRSAGAGFIMTYQRSGHVHCDWGVSRPENLTISCPR